MLGARLLLSICATSFWACNFLSVSALVLPSLSLDKRQVGEGD